jgi:hypothetical protein
LQNALWAKLAKRFRRRKPVEGQMRASAARRRIH